MNWIAYAAPHTSGLRGVLMSRPALAAITPIVMPPTVRAALKRDGVLQ